MKDAISTVTAYNIIPYNVIKDDIVEATRFEFFQELGEIVKLYEAYRKGAEFTVEGSNGDYVSSELRYKRGASIINKEARFLFSNTPDFTINQNDLGVSDSDLNTILQDYLNKVLKRTKFSEKLLKAAKDCFIGRRVACFLNFDEKKGISISFLNSIEFLYEVSGADELTKIVAIYTVVPSTNNAAKRVRKKTYEMENGFCYASEATYNGAGELLTDEPSMPRTRTLFTYIPACVIINDGLTGDSKGTSEMEQLVDSEASYSKIANADIDAERKAMNSVKYAIDADPSSTENLSSAPGSFWDIQSNQTGADGTKASVGMIEASMTYSAALKTTLDRIDNMMHDEMDVPNINSEQLQGVITSGKTLKALYWGLTVRCDEKMLTWGPALEFIGNTIIEGGRLYPMAAKFYTKEKIPSVEYNLQVVNNYPLPEDKVEEKSIDIAEVGAQVMSKKYYMIKWRQLTDDAADAELKQIALEKSLLEDSMMMTPQDSQVKQNDPQKTANQKDDTTEETEEKLPDEEVEDSI